MTIETSDSQQIVQAITLGAKTQLGGVVVTASTTTFARGNRVACVGDIVRYPDGHEEHIVSGAGEAMAYLGRPYAIIGSQTASGDTIIESPTSNLCIHVAEAKKGKGFLVPGFLCPPAADLLEAIEIGHKAMVSKLLEQQ